MSPLACSLLALAALLAVTTALSLPDPYCGELNLGSRTADPRYFKIQGHGGLHFIPNKCAPNGALGMQLVGQSVVVCNWPTSKPKITQVDQDSFMKVLVDCPSNTYGCEDLSIQVTQYCDVVGPQKPKVHVASWI